MSTTTPKFSCTFCSQCGEEFGPGDHGYSHCRDHDPVRKALKQATDHAEWCANETFGGKGVEVEKMRRYWASDEPAIYAQWLMWKEVLGEKVEASDE